VCPIVNLTAFRSTSPAPAAAAMPEELLGRWPRGCKPRAGSLVRSGALGASVRGGRLCQADGCGTAIRAVHEGVAGMAVGTPVNTALFGSDPGRLSLDFGILSPPVQGHPGEITPVDDVTAEFTYTPPASFPGPAHFLYRAYDGAAGNGTRSAPIAGSPPAGPELGQHAGVRPLTVQSRALTASGNALPDVPCCWKLHKQEDCGDAASHGKKDAYPLRGQWNSRHRRIRLLGAPPRRRRLPAVETDTAALGPERVRSIDLCEVGAPVGFAPSAVDADTWGRVGKAAGQRTHLGG
jgi:hypothetical protein